MSERGAGAGLLVAAVVLAAAAGCGKKQTPAPPPPEVKVATVLQHDVPINIEVIGETRGSPEVEIRARVEGFLETVDFEEGTRVSKGQLLFTIDPTPVRGRRSPRPRARSPGRGAARPSAQDVARFKPLVEKNAIPRQDYDNALVRAAPARGARSPPRARWSSAAAIDLSYTRDHLADRRPRRQGRGPAGQPRRPRPDARC